MITRSPWAGLGKLPFSPATLVKPTQMTFTPITPAEGECTSDGSMIWHNGHWERLGVGAQCTTIGPLAVNVDVHGVTCATPPSDGVVVRPYEHWGPDDPMYNITIVLANAENVPITYYLNCVNPNVLALTERQLIAIVESLQDPPGGPVRKLDRDLLPLSTLIPSIPGLRGQAVKAVYHASSAIWTFKTPDGDTKNVFLQMGWDQGVNTFTFTYSHQPTLFQSVDSFLSSLSPISTDQLCSLLPIATKVPNPYVAAGSLILQMSGKCPTSCPTGMLFDSAAKTCSCPPGTAYNTDQKICMPVSPPPKKINYTPWIIGGIIAIAGILFLTRKPATS